MGSWYRMPTRGRNERSCYLPQSGMVTFIFYVDEFFHGTVCGLLTDTLPTEKRGRQSQVRGDFPHLSLSFP